MSNIYFLNLVSKYVLYIVHLFYLPYVPRFVLGSNVCSSALYLFLLDHLLCSLTAGSPCTGSHAADICVRAGPGDMAFTTPRWVSLRHPYPLLPFLTHQVLFISVHMNVCLFVCVFVCFGTTLCVQCLCV